MNSILIIFGIIISTYPSCDVVESPYMVDGNIIPVDTNSVARKMLIEDFTGHLCSQCPNAANELASLQNLYGDRVIGIAIHSNTGFNVPLGLQGSQGEYSYDFRTQWGVEIDNLLGPIVGLPIGMINRGGLTEWENWGEAVLNELEEDPVFSITLSSNMTSNNGTISVSIEALTDLSEQYNIVVCLTEDSIINWQLNGSQDEEFYKHNHILRSIINTTLGDTISSSFINGNTWSKDYAIDLSSLEQFNVNYSLNTLGGNGNSDGWIADNMRIVAYIYNTNNYEIVQVEEIHLTNH